MENRIRGERIRRLREDLGMSQGDLSAILEKTVPGTNQSHVSQVERGEKGFRVETLAACALALQTSMDYLVGLTDDPTAREDMAEQVILVEKDPERREYLQRMFSAMERLTPEERDTYWRTLQALYTGVAGQLRDQNARRAAWLQDRPTVGMNAK